MLRYRADPTRPNSEYHEARLAEKIELISPSKRDNYHPLASTFPVISAENANNSSAETSGSIIIWRKRTGKMSKFEYPRFPRHEIIAVLAGSQIAAVSETDLLHPDPDFICNLYTHILLHMDALQSVKLLTLTPN